MKHRTGLNAALTGLAAALASTAAIDATAAPVTQVIETGQAGWLATFDNIVTGPPELGAAMAYDCVASGPQCISVTSNGFADGSWVNGVSANVFNGQWTASYLYTLPTGATNVRFEWEYFGVDDEAFLSLVGTNGDRVYLGNNNLANSSPTGSIDLSAFLGGLLAAAGDYFIELEMWNDPSGMKLGPVPITDVDGTAVSFRAQLSYELRENTVSAPGTLALAGLGLLAVCGLGRKGERRRAGLQAAG